MHRVFVPPEAVRDDQILIHDAGTCHHLRDVLRLRRGDRIECFDGQGHRYVGPIIRVSRRQLIVAVEQHAAEAPAPMRVVLAQAIIKPQRFDWVIQKATELGVTAIVPVLTARATVRPAPPRLTRLADPAAKAASSRRSRWARIAQEAAAQCGRATVPVVEEPRQFSEVLSRLNARPALMLTLADEGLPLQEAAHRLKGAAEVVVFIGPEGDFTPEEVRLAGRHGVRAVRLGRLTLRSETAAIATLAILQHLLGGL